MAHFQAIPLYIFDMPYLTKVKVRTHFYKDLDFVYIRFWVIDHSSHILVWIMDLSPNFHSFTIHGKCFCQSFVRSVLISMFKYLHDNGIVKLECKKENNSPVIVLQPRSSAWLGIDLMVWRREGLLQCVWPHLLCERFSGWYWHQSNCAFVSVHLHMHSGIIPMHCSIFNEESNKMCINVTANLRLNTL